MPQTTRGQPPSAVREPRSPNSSDCAVPRDPKVNKALVASVRWAARRCAGQTSMKREYPDSPLVGVGAIIIQDGRVLLVKRGHPPLAGEWSIPGGVLELGETVRAAAVREAREETCLTVEPEELLGRL